MNSKRDVHDASRRLGIFVNGKVGLSLLRKTLEYSPESLVALVINSDSLLGGLELPMNCDIRIWKDDDEYDVAEWLLSRQLDVLVLAWWPHIVKGALLEVASVTLNTHPSLLPHCRGKDPNFWAIIEGAPFGVTIHHVTSAIDAGDLAFQMEIPILWSDTGGTLYEKARTAMVQLYEQSLPEIIHGTIPRIPQGEGGSLHYRKDLEAASLIELDAQTTARGVLNRLRARTFPGHPACRFYEGGDRYEVRVTIEKLD